MSLTPEQFEARLSGAGASEVPAICGLSSYAEPVDIWAVKRRLVGPKEETDRMRSGSLAEPTIAAHFAHETGGRVISVAEFTESYWAKERFTAAELDEAKRLGILRHESTRPVFASCDRFAEFENELVVCELKNVDWRVGWKWGAQGETKFPLEYLIQVQCQLYVSGLETGFLCALIGGNDFRYYRIEKDPDLWRMVLDRCRTFWPCVESGDVPGPITASDTWHQVLKARFPEAGLDKKAVLDVPDDDPDMAEALEASRAAKAADKRLEMAKNTLQLRIGDAYRIRNASLTATLVNRKGSARTDWKAVAAELAIPAAVIAKHTTTGEPSCHVKLEDEE